MKWEDTVMTVLQIYTKDPRQSYLEAQAEISFKAGMREGELRMAQKSSYLHWQEVQDAKQAGLRGVVEWIPVLIEAIKKEMWADDWGIEHSVIYPEQLDKLVKRKLKAKRKEWGDK